MQNRLPIVLSTTALLVAVFGATPLGHAAGRVIHAVPPFAKTASYAKFAGNASKLNGRKSTLSGAPGTIPVVGRNGKLPASIGAVGPQGPQGPAGPKGLAGSAGAKGDKGDKGDAGTPATSLWAAVKYDGTVLGSQGVTSVTKNPTQNGHYTVTFNRDISTCALLGDINDLALNVYWSAYKFPPSNTVTFVTFILNGGYVDETFSVAVFC